MSGYLSLEFVGSIRFVCSMAVVHDMETPEEPWAASLDNQLCRSVTRDENANFSLGNSPNNVFPSQLER